MTMAKIMIMVYDNGDDDDYGDGNCLPMVFDFYDE